MPTAPASRAVVNNRSTICAPVRFGNACASKATAPEICGAANDVPDQRYGVLLLSGARTFTPTAARYWAAPVPARSLVAAMLPVPSTEPAMMTALRALAVPATLVKASGLAAPSLPAAMTTTIPACVARPIAFCKFWGMAEPPSDMLMTRAPATRAASTPAAIVSVPNLHPPSLSSVPAVAQLPARSARNAITFASNATPCVATPLRRPAATNATAVP